MCALTAFTGRHAAEADDALKQAVAGHGQVMVMVMSKAVPPYLRITSRVKSIPLKKYFCINTLNTITPKFCTLCSQNFPIIQGEVGSLLSRGQTCEYKL